MTSLTPKLILAARFWCLEAHRRFVSLCPLASAPATWATFC